MIGQELLLETFSKYTLSNLPHSIIFLGEVGCGKHTLLNELVQRYNVNLYDISDNISNDTLDEIYINSSTPKFYLINSSQLTYLNQNKILKFIEEPLKNIYIFILTENLNILLSTIKNRCLIFQFEKYTLETLKQFSTDNLILKVCSTPGQIINILNSNYNLNDLNDLCDKIINKLNIASLSNTLSILNKLNLTDSIKYDINIFLNLLTIKYLEIYKETKLELNYKLYNIVDKYNYQLKDSRLNKKYILENLLIDLWTTSRGI